MSQPDESPEARPGAPPRKPASRDPARSRRILGLRVDAGSYASACDEIAALAREERSATVCVANVHMVMEAYRDAGFRQLVNASELVTSDGMPLVWTLRRRGLVDAQRVYGPTLTPLLCERAAAEGLPVGFYGGTPERLHALTGALRARVPALDIAFAFAPPFRPLSEDEDERVVAAIQDSGVRLLFVGLGCPKQERWMAAHRERLSCTCIGVGAAFDFLAGAKRQAPGWLQERGLEWLFRLATEPRRLWRRYLRHNPHFLWRLLLEELRGGGPR